MKLELPNTKYVENPKRVYTVYFTIKTYTKWWMDRLRLFARRLHDEGGPRIRDVRYNMSVPVGYSILISPTTGELSFSARELSMENVFRLLTWADGLNENLKVTRVEVIW